MNLYSAIKSEDSEAPDLRMKTDRKNTRKRCRTSCTYKICSATAALAAGSPTRPIQVGEVRLPLGNKNLAPAYLSYLPDDCILSSSVECALCAQQTPVLVSCVALTTIMVVVAFPLLVLGCGTVCR
jgi:hypothetical protein